MDPSSIVLHVPHSSTFIPESELGSFRIDLADELLKMTDRYCDELFCGDHPSVVFPVSRLVCDPERFRDDALEPMSKVGMGAVYTRTHDGAVLRSVGIEERERILKTYYDPHHSALTEAVQSALDKTGTCLIIDGHSFAPYPLPFEKDQRPDRPDFCIGTDPYHTPDELARSAFRFLRERGYSVAFNAPFSGSIVPMRFYRKDKRVASIMIEINRRLYMYDDGRRNEEFITIRTVVQGLIRQLSEQ